MPCWNSCGKLSSEALRHSRRRENLERDPHADRGLRLTLIDERPPRRGCLKIPGTGRPEQDDPLAAHLEGERLNEAIAKMFASRRGGVERLHSPCAGTPAESLE